MALKHFWLGMTLIAGALLLIAALCLTGCGPVNETAQTDELPSQMMLVKTCADGTDITKNAQGLWKRSPFSNWNIDGRTYTLIAPGTPLGDVCK